MNTGQICVPVCAETAEEMIAKIKRAEESADVIEVRFDCLEPAQLKKCISEIPDLKFKKTYLFTLRPKEQGGKRQLTIGERLKFWEHVLWARKTGFKIDIEFDPKILSAVNPANIERLVSLHDFEGTPDDLLSIWEMISGISASTAKIAKRPVRRTLSIRMNIEPNHTR